MSWNTRHVVNMANSIVGVSILSMPYCFKEAGLLLGVVMVLFSGFVTKKTCMFLVRAATMARHHSYEFLAFHVFGVRGKLAVELCMILFLIGICISFHVVMGDLAPALAAHLLNIPLTPSLRATLLLGIAVLVVLPLCLLRKLDNLASMSACSILFYFFLITVIFWHAFPRLVDGSWYQMARLWRPTGVLQVFPICMLGLSCQSNVFEIYESVQDADVPKMRAVVNQALNLCCALYISVGFFGYIAFVDQDMAGNVIMNLPATPLTEGIKLFFTASLAISFPLMIFPCRTSIHSLVYCRNNQGFDLVRNYMPENRFKAITVLILAVSLIVGILIPNIEFVLGMLGSTMGVIISLVLPCLMFIKVNSKASVERLVAQGIMIMGVVLIATGTYFNLTHSPQPQNLPQQLKQQPVIAMPPPMLREELLRKEPAVEALPLPAISVTSPKRPLKANPLAPGAAPGLDDARREPVAPEPPVEGVGVGEGQAGEPRREAREGDTLHPDAIKKEKEVNREEKASVRDDIKVPREAGAIRDSLEVSRDAVGAGKEVEQKQQELLQKIEVQHQEQQKILEEQKQILQELKDQKLQQEQAVAAAAAAVAAIPQQGGVQQVPVGVAGVGVPVPGQQSQPLPPQQSPHLQPQQGNAGEVLSVKALPHSPQLNVEHLQPQLPHQLPQEPSQPPLELLKQQQVLPQQNQVVPQSLPQQPVVPQFDLPQQKQQAVPSPPDPQPPPNPPQNQQEQQAKPALHSQSKTNQAVKPEQHAAQVPAAAQQVPAHAVDPEPPSAAVPVQQKQQKQQEQQKNQGHLEIGKLQNRNINFDISAPKSPGKIPSPETPRKTLRDAPQKPRRLTPRPDAKKGPQGYLDKISGLAPGQKLSPDLRRKRSVAQIPGLPEVPQVLDGAGALHGVNFETRHLL